MIRFIHCIKRKQDISVEDFRSFWNGGELEALIKKAQDMLKAKHIRKNLTLDIALNNRLQQQRNAEEPYDAVLEFIWTSGKSLGETEITESYQKFAQEMEDAQKDVVDFKASKRFFTEYHE